MKLMEPEIPAVCSTNFPDRDLRACYLLIGSGDL